MDMGTVVIKNSKIVNIDVNNNATFIVLKPSDKLTVIFDNCTFSNIINKDGGINAANGLIAVTDDIKKINNQFLKLVNHNRVEGILNLLIS